MTAMIGVATYSMTKMQEAIVGYSCRNPHFVAATLACSVLTKLAHIKLSEQATAYEVKKWADYFSRVANNLYALYNSASEAVVEYF